MQNLGDAVVDCLKTGTQGNDRSLKAEVRHIREQSAKMDDAQGLPDCPEYSKETKRQNIS